MKSRSTGNQHHDVFGQARRAFERWRSDRKPGTRIPERLWKSAAQLARSHGVNPTAKALGLDYYSLKRRLDDSESTNDSQAGRRDHRDTFVEIPSAPEIARSPACTFIVEKPDGMKLRVEFAAPGGSDIEALARTFLSAAR